MGNFKMKSNLKNLSKELEKEVLDKAHKVTFDIPCPHCGDIVPVKSGTNVCTACDEAFDFDLNLVK